MTGLSWCICINDRTETRSSAPEKLRSSLLRSPPWCWRRWEKAISRRGRQIGFLFCDGNAFIYLKNIFHQREGRFLGGGCIPEFSMEMLWWPGLTEVTESGAWRTKQGHWVQALSKELLLQLAGKGAREARSSQFPRGWKSQLLMRNL